jgi:Sec-independent protein translocase protein TatA
MKSMVLCANPYYVSFIHSNPEVFSKVGTALLTPAGLSEDSKRREETEKKLLSILHIRRHSIRHLRVLAGHNRESFSINFISHIVASNSSPFITSFAPSSFSPSCLVPSASSAMEEEKEEREKVGGAECTLLESVEFSGCLSLPTEEAQAVLAFLQEGSKGHTPLQLKVVSLSSCSSFILKELGENHSQSIRALSLPLTEAAQSHFRPSRFAEGEQETEITYKKDLVSLLSGLVNLEELEIKDKAGMLDFGESFGTDGIATDHLVSVVASASPKVGSLPSFFLSLFLFLTLLLKLEHLTVPRIENIFCAVKATHLRTFTAKATKAIYPSTENHKSAPGQGQKLGQVTQGLLRRWNEAEADEEEDEMDEDEDEDEEDEDEDEDEMDEDQQQQEVVCSNEPLDEVFTELEVLDLDKPVDIDFSKCGGGSFQKLRVISIDQAFHNTLLKFVTPPNGFPSLQRYEFKGYGRDCKVGYRKDKSLLLLFF